jgi:hypothetical protein
MMHRGGLQCRQWWIFHGASFGRRWEWGVGCGRGRGGGTARRLSSHANELDGGRITRWPEVVVVGIGWWWCLARPKVGDGRLGHGSIGPIKRGRQPSRGREKSRPKAKARGGKVAYWADRGGGGRLGGPGRVGPNWEMDRKNKFWIIWLLIWMNSNKFQRILKSKPKFELLQK